MSATDKIQATYPDPLVLGDGPPVVRCGYCGTTISQDYLDAHDVQCCPICEDGRERPVNPQAVREDILLPINWLDVRCLVQWAEREVQRWGKPDADRRWERLKERIRQHAPEGAAPLTLFDELDDLRADGLDVTYHESEAP